VPRRNLQRHPGGNGVFERQIPAMSGPARQMLSTGPGDSMTDLLLVLATTVFFSLALGYVRLSEKL